VISALEQLLRGGVARRALARRLAALVVLLGCVLAGGSPRAAAAAPLRVSLLTMGPGDSLVTMFGHDALLVEWDGLRPLVYNFGMYTPESITIPRVLSGHLRYYLHVDRYEHTQAQYRREGRSLLVQRLALSPARAEALAAALSMNSLPANAAYRYDYSRDNCTTRVRDALDRALDGALRRTLAGDTKRTYRDHALRLTADHPLFAFLFDLGLGASADRPLSAWDDAYLPDRLAEAVRAVRVPEGGPLVEKEELAYDGLRAVRRDPPLRAPWFALKGVLIGGCFFLLGVRPGRATRVLFGTLLAVTAFLSGLVGLWLLGLLLTEVHPATHANVNLLLTPPWVLALVPSAVGVALGRARSLRFVARGAFVVLVGALVGSVMMPFVGQKAVSGVLLFVPAWLGVLFGARRLAARLGG